MNIGIIAKRYAKTLLLFSLENKEEDRVYNEVKQLSQVLVQVPELLSTLKNPVIKYAAKMQILQSAIHNEAAISDSLTTFLSLLLKKSREEILPFIAQSYQTLYCNHKHIINGKLTIPQSLSEESLERLKKVVENKTKCNVDFAIDINPEIQAGFILKYDTYMLDASLTSQLKNLRKQLH